MPDNMATVSFTDEQLQAVRTTGRSVIVSAAAGSGKTAVLAERCAYLVCDAPPLERCDVGELLVLTFTDAAAAEMRSRIVETLRARALERPEDDRLREQVALVDTAQICTIHSFCLWLVRRWFSHVGVDPVAGIMDDDETALLKSDLLDSFFAELYGAVRTSADEPLGTATAGVDGTAESEPHAANVDSSPTRPSADTGLHRARLSGDALAVAFRQLVDDYGLGEDRGIARFVLRLHDFLTSLPDPEGWIEEACTSLSDQPERFVLTTADALTSELAWQIEHGEHVVEAIETGDPIGHPCAKPVRGYLEQLRAWTAAMGVGDHATGKTGLGSTPDSETAEVLARFDSVREQIEAFRFERLSPIRLAKDASDAERAAVDAAKSRLKEIREGLFDRRLEKRFGLFSVDEWIAGLKQTAPYVTTIADLTLAFRDIYLRNKRTLSVLDFADFERLAFDLLSCEGDPERPSEVARSLHRRFTYVLVDEFQDINPIQQAIIELASREHDPERANNLFVVGDVKQSIYRFRLAEPSVFIDRLDRFRAGWQGGDAVALQANFRSRPNILEAVNTIFRQLMRPGCADIIYDEEAELRAGRLVDPPAVDPPVELHLLERKWNDHDVDDAEPERGVSDHSDPARWAPIEREAYLIGSHISDLIASGEPGSEGNPLRYRDVAILLRAAKVNAERMASMLSAMGIPAHADVGGSLFGAREVRDVTAALELLDNSQQDIPLAAVLRSGIMGDPFSDDDLVEIRCLDRSVPFHAAVREYAENGENRELCERLGYLLGRLERFREQVRRRPLADVLWSLYRKNGYLAGAGGLQSGEQRRANLLKLHELARQFGSFRRQGLHRFLRFIGRLEEEGRSVASAPAISEADDVVRIMSIHQAKGLEFPVVFLAGMGTRFNLGDRSGRMIFERKAKIGLRVVDTDSMVEYPSAAHSLVVDEIERTAREEELRILYVALTRARDKLVLVGSQRDVERHRIFPSPSVRDEELEGARTPSRLSVATATTPLDWLIPALAAAQAGSVQGLGVEPVDNPTISVHFHDVPEMSSWRVGRGIDKQNELARRAAARLEVLPEHEPLAPEDWTVEQTLTRIAYTYPQSASASAGATLAASEFKGALDYLRDPEQRIRGSRPDDFRIPPTKYAPYAADESAHRGMITHTVLQHLDFAVATDASGVASELQRMVDERVIVSEDRTTVDQGSIEWFLTTPLAAAIRRAGDAYRREFPYITAEPLAFVDPSTGPPSDDYVLVRGIVDGILPSADGLEIVDFKTDRIRTEEVGSRSQRYRPQMALYSRALSRLWRLPVRRSWLVFLTPRTFVTWDDPAAGVVRS